MDIQTLLGIFVLENGYTICILNTRGLLLILTF